MNFIKDVDLNCRLLTVGEMMNVQNKLNEITVEMWQHNITINQFKVAAFDELSEMMNTVPWAWWKSQKSPEDIWNLRLEAIDVLHFMLSIFVLKVIDTEQRNIYFGTVGKSRNFMVTRENTLNHNAFINVSATILHECSVYSVNDMFYCLGMNQEEVSALYVAKVELNKIRQENGYKKGMYNKMSKGGVEDNEVLRDLVSEFMKNDEMVLDELRKRVRASFVYATE